MKRTLLFIACVLASLTMSAQEGSAVEDSNTSYHPFLKEGKTWNYQEYYHNVWNDEQWTKEISYVINGTTEIDGKTYYKMYRISEDGSNYYCALREEDRKVWQYTSDEGNHLIYDFGMSVGDSYTPTYEPFIFQLTSIKPMWFHDDQLLHVLFYDVLTQYDPTGPATTTPIVEGVGCENGWNIVEYYAAVPTNGIIYRKQFLSCYEDGKCIFTADDFNHLTDDNDMAYRPMVEDDKVWAVRVYPDGYGIVRNDTWTEYYYFDGDTIIGGQACKQMKYVTNANEENWVNGVFTPADLPQSYVGAWYEQDKKVYYAGVNQQQFKLLYDFTLPSGYRVFLDGSMLVVYKASGDTPGFKGTCYQFYLDGGDYVAERWLEGVGSDSWPWLNHRYEFCGSQGVLLSCRVGDEIIYYNSEVEDPYVMNARRRFDFTHTIKTQPKTPASSLARSKDACKARTPLQKTRGTVREVEQSLYGEYNEQQLGINLDPIDDAYTVRITDGTGKVVYEKAIDAGSIVGLNIDISAYAEDRYTVTVENSSEVFTGEFETLTSGIEEVRNKNGETRSSIYNLQGQRINSLQKGLNIVNGRKTIVR